MDIVEVTAFVGGRPTYLNMLEGFVFVEKIEVWIGRIPIGVDKAGNGVNMITQESPGG